MFKFAISVSDCFKEVFFRTNKFVKIDDTKIVLPEIFIWSVVNCNDAKL